MATSAHCLYCFESLSAKLEKRAEPEWSLKRVKQLWETYSSSEESGVKEQGVVEIAEDIDGSEPPAKILKRTGFDYLSVPSLTPRSQASTPSSVSTTSSTAKDSILSGNSKSSSTSSIVPPEKPSNVPTPVEDVDSPLFVTWNTIGRSGHKSLRGCIGTFEALELEEGLHDYALTAALEDTRFMPIGKKELPSLEVGVTLLTNFEPCPTPMDWDLGKHGIRISFNYHSRHYGATYLPDVAVEQGWTKEETMVSLMRKAGWPGKKSEWQKVPDLKTIRYQGSKSAVDYDKWIAWRSWAKEHDNL